MTPRSTAEVSLGVAGVYVLATWVPHGVGMFLTLLDSEYAPRAIQWSGIAYLAVSALSGIGLLSFRRRLAAWLCPEPEPRREADGTAGAGPAAIAVLGLYLVATGVSALVGQLAHVAAGERWRFEASAEELARVAIGAGLVLGARGLAGTWRLLRRAGRRAGRDGSVDGPPDLSTNPKHMDGYGE